MKKKYFILLLAVAFIFASSVGGALWIILSENQVGISLYEKKDVTVSVTIDPIYYGNEISLGTKTATYDGVTVEGSWSIIKDDNKETYVASGTLTNDLLQTDATVTAVFEPDDKMLYKVTETKITVPMRPIALYGTTYYSRLDDALKAANNNANGGTVYALALGKTVDEGVAEEAKTISKVAAINSNVTLFLPYTEDYLDTDEKGYTALKPQSRTDAATGESIPDEPTNTSRYEFSMLEETFNTDTYNINQIYIAKGHTLTNNGTVIVGGEVSGGNGGSPVNSRVAGRHGRINLKDNATIINENTLNCYGYIMGGNTTNVVSETGTLQAIITIVEHRGGSGFFGLIDPTNRDVYQKIIDLALEGSDITSWPIYGKGESNYSPDTLQTSPFNRFYFENITAPLTVKPTSVVNAYGNLYADNQNNETIMKIVGASGSGALVELGANAQLNAKYDYLTKTHYFDFYGNVKINPITLTISVKKSVPNDKPIINVVMNVNMNTGNLFFPVSNHLQVSFNKSKTDNAATVDLLSGQGKFKLLPGSVVDIGEGVTVNAGSIAVYQNNNLINQDNFFKYQETDSAQLNIAGTLNVNEFGGIANATSSNAKLVISNNSVMSKEIKTLAAKDSTVSLALKDASNGLVELAGAILNVAFDLPYRKVDYFTNAECVHGATGDTFNVSGTEQVNTTLAVGTYYGMQVAGGSNNYAWLSEFNAILDANAANATFESNGQKQLVYRNDKSGLETAEFEKPVRPHYTFAGWYYDSACTKPADNVIYAGTTLYAKWVGVPYDIKYWIYDDEQGIYVEHDPSAEGNATTFTVESNFNLKEPINGNMVFEAWYSDEERTAQISMVNGKAIIGDAVTYELLNLYGVWAEDGLKYTVTIVNEKDVNSPYTIRTTAENAADAIAQLNTLLPILDNGEKDDIKKEYYFEGWSTENGELIEQLSESLFSEGSCTITAKWVTKYSLKIDVNNADLGFDSGIDIAVTDLYLYSGQQYDGIPGLEDMTIYDYNIAVSKYFGGWHIDGTAEIDGTTVVISSNVTVKAIWSNKHRYELNVNNMKVGECTSYKVTVDGADINVNTGDEIVVFYVRAGSTVRVEVTANTYNGTGFEALNQYAYAIKVRFTHADGTFVESAATGGGGFLGMGMTKTRYLEEAAKENGVTVISLVVV